MESTSEMTNRWFVQRVALPMAQGRSVAALDRREELPSTRDPSSHSRATTTIGAPKLTTYGFIRGLNSDDGSNPSIGGNAYSVEQSLVPKTQIRSTTRARYDLEANRMIDGPSPVFGPTTGVGDVAPRFDERVA